MKFTYKAKKGPTEVIEDVIEAENEDSALAKISSLGLIPIKISSATGSSGISPVSASKKTKAAVSSTVHVQAAPDRSRVRVAYKQLNIFTRQFAILMKASVPLLRIFEILHSQTSDVKFQAVLKDIQDVLRQGSSLSDALSHYPKIFSQVYVNMVQSGEVSGTLDKVLLQLSEFAEKEAEVRARVQGAVVYPLFLLAMGILTIFILLTFVMPRMISLFGDLGTELPGPTKVVMAASHFCQKYWIAIVLAVSSISVFLRTKGLNASQKRAIDGLVLKLPVIGNLIQKAESARFLRSMELLYEHGIALYQAVAVANKTVSNSLIREELEKVPARLEGGATLAHSLAEVPYISKFVTHMVSVGEESGQLGPAIRETASFYEQETNQMIKIATSMLEPLMILGIGIMVGFIVIAMLLPIFEIHVMAQ